VWSLFQLYAAGFGAFDAITLRGWHVLFLLVIVFLLYPARKKNIGASKRPSVFDIIFIMLRVVALGYVLFNYQEVVLRGGYLMTKDYLLGSFGIFVLIVAVRRVVGNFAFLALVFLFSKFLGMYVPGTLTYSAFTINRALDYLLWGSDGIFRVGSGAWATVVF